MHPSLGISFLLSIAHCCKLCLPISNLIKLLPIGLGEHDVFGLLDPFCFALPTPFTLIYILFLRNIFGLFEIKKNL
jgi:hypothetical protein